MASAAREELPANERRKRCNMIFYNLLSTRSDMTVPSIYVRTLHETEGCDNVLGSMEHVRQRYREKMGATIYDHIQRSDDISSDQEHAASRAVFYYFQWTEQELLKGLDWQYWFKYNFVVQAERTLAIFGIASAAIGARKVLKNYKQRSEKLKRPQPTSVKPQTNSTASQQPTATELRDAATARRQVSAAHL